MPCQIAIIDYGMGNIGNVKNALDFLGFSNVITRNSDVIRKAHGVILPGVGAFGVAMKNLKDYHLIEPILSHIKSNKPFLGVCLGLQLLFGSSEEAPGVSGLGIFSGRILKFDFKDLKVPHIGWNMATIKKPHPLLANIPNHSYFYFVHSYYAAYHSQDYVATTTNYGVEFVSGVAKDNIFAFQFHPEKSQKDGLQIYKNFGELCENHSSN